MGEIKIGRVRISMRGAWSNATTYIALDAVSYNGSSYVAVQDVPTGTVPTNTTYWMLIAAKGDQGIQGPVGPMWFTGVSNPSSAAGVVNDLHLNTSTGDVFKKTGASTWTLQGNIKGPQGQQGVQGNQGIQGNEGPQGPQGNTGATGPAGPPNSLSIGSVVTGSAGSTASASVTGSSPNQQLNLVIPRGDKGDIGNTGPANTLSVGTVTTAPAGSPAEASVTGTAPNQTLNLTIPKGQDGLGLTDGDKGDILVSGTGTIFTIDNAAVTTDKIAGSAVTNQKIAGDAVDNTQLFNMPANTIKARRTSLGDPEDLTVEQFRQLADLATDGIRCYLNSSTSIAIRPTNGGRILIGGVSRPITSTTLINTQFTNSTSQFVYAFWSGSSTTYEVSTTTPTLHTDGTMIKNGDSSRAFICWVYRWSDGNFYDEPGKRLVLSWFNQKEKSVVCPVSGGIVGSGAIGTGTAYFLAFPDISYSFLMSGYFSVNSADYLFTAPRVDSVSGTEHGDYRPIGQYGSIGGVASLNPTTFALHTLQGGGRNSATSTATINGSAFGNIRG